MEADSSQNSGFAVGVIDLPLGILGHDRGSCLEPALEKGLAVIEAESKKPKEGLKYLIFCIAFYLAFMSNRGTF